MKTILLSILLFPLFFGNALASINDSLFTEAPIKLITKTGTIFGTLTLPQTSGKHAVALIIAGSGPTDRNGNNPMMINDSYKLLAHELAQKHIASVRYDKRGIAESANAGKKEADLRFDDYVADAADWIQLLKQDKRFSKTIVIGHSEGSLIGMMASSAANKFISIAGAGQSADKILKTQLAAQPQEVQNLCSPIIDSLAAGKLVSDVNPMLNSLFRTSVQPYMISWFKYDPQAEIARLKIPILIIQGTHDIQVTVADANRLAKANPSSKLTLIDNMNHVLRIVEGDKTANMKSYSDASLPISGDLLMAITTFVLKD